ncbi:MAG: DUF4369 domain-containing protein [Prevotella sp.]|nr:DUF4369 domain-containing protein [Prevotella sp.]
MYKIIYGLIVACALASCAESYSVHGASSVSALDGSKLYLKAIKDNEVKNLDSCEVVHGQFRFAGLLDTVCMANLFMDDESIMPVVLEKGEISIKIDNASQIVSGTPLNEKLYEFIDFHNQLDNQMAELSHKQSQMLLDGVDEQEINEQLSIEAAEIARREDSLVTNFIVENFDNVLGPGVFMMMTSGYRYPVLTPQIEDIMSKASAKFKNDPYVKDYYQVATENQARQNGLHEVEPQPKAPLTNAPLTNTPLTNEKAD